MFSKIRKPVVIALFALLICCTTFFIVTEVVHSSHQKNLSSSKIPTSTAKTSIQDTNTPILTIDKSKLSPAKHLDGDEFSGPQELTGTLDTKGKKLVSFKLVVKDDHNNEIGSYDISPNNQWSISDFGLIRGTNILAAVAMFEDKTTLSDSATIGYNKTDKLDKLSLDSNDSDGDGLINYMETYYGTDSHKKDTDDDGLSDLTEIAATHTNPTKKDSDNNGVSDGDEDSDYDGVPNLKELRVGTDLASRDTDLDSLTDGDELTKYHTNPCKSDTDDDGANDGWEVETSSNPLSAQANFQVKTTQQIENATTILTATTHGSEVKQVCMLPMSGTAIDLTQTPGYVAGYEFHAPKDSKSVKIEFNLDKKLFDNPDFEPAVYKYNSETQVLEEQPAKTEDKKITLSPEELANYLVIDKHSFKNVWKSDIATPSTQDNLNTGIDYCFVVDCSPYMMQKDPKFNRVTFTHKLIDQLGPRDRASLIAYWGGALPIGKFTNDKDVLHTQSNAMKQYNLIGINAANGVSTALEHLEKYGYSYANKKIILLSGGEKDSWANEYSLSKLTEKAKEKSIQIYTVVICPEISNEWLYQLKNMSQETGGKCYRIDRDDLSTFTGQIFNDSVDYQKDSNRDGISDHYADLIKQGKLTLANGTTPYIGIDFSNPDYDGDGYLNGQELKVCTYYSPDGNRYIYLKQISNPTVKEQVRPVTARTLATFAALCYEDGEKAKANQRFYQESEIIGEGEKGDIDKTNRGQSYYFLNGANIFDPNRDGHISKTWKIVEYWNDKVFGSKKVKCSATVYARGNDVVLAYRGTDEDLEWLHDGIGYLANVTFEEPYAKTMARTVAEKYAANGKSVYITGHSLGGYLAQIGAAEFLKTSYKNQLKTCEYFNGMGLDYAYWAQQHNLPLPPWISVPNPTDIFTHEKDRKLLEHFWAFEHGRVFSHRIKGDFVFPMGIHSGLGASYPAAKECIEHHIATRGDGLNDSVGIAAVGAIVLANGGNFDLVSLGLTSKAGGYTLLWIAHETDSFFYNDLDDNHYKTPHNTSTQNCLDYESKTMVSGGAVVDYNNADMLDKFSADISNSDGDGVFDGWIIEIGCAFNHRYRLSFIPKSLSHT